MCKISFSAQRWKYDDNTGYLINKKGQWNSLNMYIRTFPDTGTTGNIVLHDGRALGVANDNTLSGTKTVLEALDVSSTAQLWSHSQPDDKGWFVLRNQRSRKFLTATSATEATIEGTFNLDH